MSASFYDLMKYAHTGLATADMTAFDKLRAQGMAGGGAIKTLTGVPPLSFTGNGTPLISWSMKGNGQQSGTPAPDNPIMPTFCGKLVGSDWTIPITCAGQTTPIYLGQTQTVRRVKKMVLDGTEDWASSAASQGVLRFYLQLENVQPSDLTIGVKSKCTHFPLTYTGNTYNMNNSYTISTDQKIFFRKNSGTTLNGWKQWLSEQHAAGTPVTVWYVLAEPETAIVNEPLCKIGDYTDELNSTDAAITIPTANGENTLTVDTDLKPSSMTITYR